MCIRDRPMVVEGLAKSGIPEHLALPIGLLELACTILYIIPQTAVLGAILLTGYLGGAIMTHLRVGEAWIGPAVFGVFIWGGFFLRDPRLARSSRSGNRSSEHFSRGYKAVHAFNKRGRGE